MTLRAFLIGLLTVAGVTLLSPYGAWIKRYGWLSNSSFPNGAVLVIVLLTLGLNLLLKLLRRGWELRRAELMLVWCMLIVGLTIPGDGVGRFWYSAMAGGPYLARRADLPWEEGGSLALAPENLVLSKNPRSEAARRFFEGGGEKGRVPWRQWARPLLTWSAFLVVLYLATFFLCAILRRQWVEVERLMFPLARVPLEFTQEAGGGRLLPGIFYDRAFRVGLAAAGLWRLILALPLFFGAETPMAFTVPFQDAFQGTPLQYGGFANLNVSPFAVGFAFLVPADVSLSVWFFFLFSRAQILVSRWLALPEGAGTWSPLMSWQQVGAYIAFAGGAFYMARRHLLRVARRALGRPATDDESGEPVPYPVAFWGCLLALGLCVTWYWVHGMRVLTAVAFLALMFCWYIAYARMVAQGGLYVARTIWDMEGIVNGLSGGHALTPPGAVIGRMQTYMLVRGGTVFLAPMAMNAFRISEVFERGRRWLLPAMLAATLVGMFCGTYTVLTQAYSMGAANFADNWSQLIIPQNIFDGAHRMITQPTVAARAYLRPLFTGMGLMGLMMFLRARFYWWPIHGIGLMTCSSWHAQRLWFQFLLGWAIKVGIMKFTGGRTLRKARRFFIAVIMVEGFLDGASVLVRTLTGGAAPPF